WTGPSSRVACDRAAWCSILPGSDRRGACDGPRTTTGWPPRWTSFDGSPELVRSTRDPDPLRRRDCRRGSRDGTVISAGGTGKATTSRPHWSRVTPLVGFGDGRGPEMILDSPALSRGSTMGQRMRLSRLQLELPNDPRSDPDTIWPERDGDRWPFGPRACLRG